ncbi:CRISPR-associated protein Cas4 [Bacillus sp. FJAT-42315]|uniref:CRISPR-associated protein Cas4 n=1 Tax=Bacillus sp. FJAT-42315 TaxID=2014077 RepID=UPI000C23BCA2|nr:CRISPR-associated protein Cas4 [Bacillus sp. FJAT-42315]
MEQIEDIKVTGLQIQYYHVCKRKLWLSSHQISFEDEYDVVLQGKMLHETSYQRAKMKEVMVDDFIKIDMLNSEYVGEVKSSSKMEEADRAQLLYYLYVLFQMGVERKGKIHYPKEKRVEEIELTPQHVSKIESWLEDIKKIISAAFPPKKEKYPYCTKCAYYQFCWVGEE